MSLRDELNLIEGEQAWWCDVAKVAGGVVVEVDELAFDAWADVLKPIAARLYLEVHEVDGRIALVHRAGWPFDLRTFERDPLGVEASELRPTGAGDEVMRDLIESFESSAPSHSLHVRSQ